MAQFRDLRLRLFFLLTSLSPAVILTVGAIGCGSTGPLEELVPVSGTVKFDGELAERAAVSFIPYGKNTKAHMGTGLTTEDGQFEMFNYQMKSGMPPGTYIVTVSLRRSRDGSLPPVNDRLNESGALEVIPPEWNLVAKAGGHNKVTVPEEGKMDFEFNIPKVMPAGGFVDPAKPPRPR